MFYKAKFLVRAEERIAEQHPVKADELEGGAAFAKSAIGRRLRKKLERAELSDLSALVTGLSTSERRFFAATVLEEDEDIRRKAVRCLFIDETLGRFRHLWESICRYFRSDTAKSSAQLIGNVDDFRNRANHYQRKISSRRTESVVEASQAFWEGVRDQSSFEAFSESISLPVPSELSRTVRVFLLIRGARDIWEMVEPEDLADLYRRQDVDIRGRGLQHAHRLYGSEDGAWIPPGPRAIALVKELQTDDDALDWLEANAPDVAEWCRKVLRYVQLSDFFDDLEQNERFDFWEQYVPFMHDLDIDRKNLRVFIDFGGFGVIEFGEVGNASYVYPQDVFRDFRDKNARYLHTYSDHNTLKDKAEAITTMTHHSGWQGKFRRRLAVLLSELG